MGAVDAVSGLIDALLKTGPYGALAAAVIIGCTLALIVFARTTDLWSGIRSRGQEVAFQAKLLELIDRLSASEDALRKRVDELSRDKATLVDDLDELRASLALLRNQRRRLIDLLRASQPARTRP